QGLARFTTVRIHGPAETVRSVAVAASGSLAGRCGGLQASRLRPRTGQSHRVHGVEPCGSANRGATLRRELPRPARCSPPRSASEDLGRCASEADLAGASAEILAGASGWCAVLSCRGNNQSSADAPVTCRRTVVTPHATFGERRHQAPSSRLRAPCC